MEWNLRRDRQRRRKGGERGRNRTYNLLIKSQLLCQLSYAPEFTSLAGQRRMCSML